MKKTLLMILFIGLLSLTINVKDVNADFGPKPSLEVTILGVDEDFHFDLLVYTTDNDLDPEWGLEYYSYYDEENFPTVLETYYDSDEYASYTLFYSPATVRYSQFGDEIDVFLMNYIAPSTFKLVIVMDDNDAIIVSEIMESSRFESKVTWDLSGVDLSTSQSGVGKINGSIVGEGYTGRNWLVTTVNTILRVIATVAIELAILYQFKFRKRETFIRVGIVNVITQVVLSILVISAFLAGGTFFYIIALILLEVVVLIVEFIAYLILIKAKSKWKLLLYVITANFASVILGTIITLLV